METNTQPAQALGSGQVRCNQKSDQLAEIVGTLNQLIDRAHELHGKIGARNLPCEVANKQPEAPLLNNLADIIEHLPGVINMKAQEVHRILDEITESLI